MTIPPTRPIAPVVHRRLNQFLKRINPWFNGLTLVFFLSWLAGRLLGRWYPFELFSHFEVQYYTLAITLMVWQALYTLIYPRRARSGLVLIPFVLLTSIVCFRNNWWKPGDSRTSDFTAGPPGDLRVFHANVLYTRDDYAPTLTLIRKQAPALYVLQEMTPASIRLVTSRLGGEFPHWFACWSKGPCWTLVGSRAPLHVDQTLARHKRIIALTTRINGRDVSLLTVHPRTPLLPSWFSERNDQLTFAARQTRRNAQPTVLIGDFNISVFSPLYDDIFRPFNPAGNGKPTQILRPARRFLTQPTWPIFFPSLMIPIDHAFVNGGFRPVRFQTLDHPGSDHRAVVVDLRFSR